MIRRPPRSTLDRSSAASDVYKRQHPYRYNEVFKNQVGNYAVPVKFSFEVTNGEKVKPVSYTHLRAHETVLDLVCRLLLEKKKYQTHILAVSNKYKNT